MSEIDFLVGETVTEIRDGNRIVFIPGEKPEPRLYADLGDCVVTDSAGEAHPVVSLVGRTVAATSTSDDVLAIEFNDGFTLRCTPDPNYESWQVVGGDPQYLVVCLPGGELAVWDKRNVPTREDAERTVQDLFGPDWCLREVTEHGGITVDRKASPEN